MPRAWFFLYRPQVPSVRAQTLQVVSTAHALAARGHAVELCVEGRKDPLADLGLDPVPTLALRRLPRGTAGSVAYRAAFAAWAVRTRGEGIALARRKKHAAWALRWLPGAFRLVLEVHEVDSVQAADQGLDPRPWRALEERVLRGAWGVVANAEGTLARLREAHGALPPAVVVHNAARPGVPPSPRGEGIGVVGSVRLYKDPDTVAAVARELPITWVGADGPVGAARTEAAVPYRLVPWRLARFRTLLLPLSPGRFGQELTSPLKLWDALASGVPLVAADTAAVRAAAAGAYVPYRPGDPGSLREALVRADRDEALRAEVVAVARRRARTWADRAAEIEAFVDQRGAG